MAGAFLVSACGGSTPPSGTPAAVVSAAPTAEAVTPAPTQAPTPAPTTLPTPTAAPEIDPAGALEIAPPYELELLDPALADLFTTSMEESMGAFGDIFEIGVRSAVEDGETIAWVIAMSFPDMPMSDLSLLDGAAAGAASGGDVEQRTILDHPVRIIDADGLSGVLTIVGNTLIIAMAEGESGAISVVTAIIEASE